MHECKCEEPRESPDPRTEGNCVMCGRAIAGREWVSDDSNLGAFFNRLAEASFPAYCTTGDKKQIPGLFFAFYRECSGRERAGRKKFGLEYLRRNNPQEAVEEAADLANYLYMEGLRRKRLEEDEEADALLTGAFYAYKAFEVCHRLSTHNWKSISEQEEN